MDENRLRQIIREEIKLESTNKQFTVAQTSFHKHNGVDSPKLQEVNLIPNTRSIALNISDASETFIVTNLPNTNTVIFNGYAADNVGQTLTQRSIVNGSANFGDCYHITSNTTGVKQTVIQGCNSMTIGVALAGTSPNQTVESKVASSVEHLAYVLDTSGNEVATIDIVAYTSGSVTFNVVLSANWGISGTLLFT